MRILIALVLIPMGVMWSVEPDQPADTHEPMTWIPTAMDDWAALQAEAVAFRSGTKAQRASFFARSTESIPKRGFLPPDMSALIPTTELGDDLIAITMSAHVNRMGTGCGETAVWRGVDGKAIGAVILWQPKYFRERDPSAFQNLDQAAAEFRERVTRQTPAQIPWKIAMDPDHNWWCATWQRPGGRLATIDERRGHADALRDSDREWLSTPPQPLPKSHHATDKAVTDPAPPPHPAVDAALARFAAGFPMRPVAIETIFNGYQIERLGWKIGDILVAFNGTPASDQSRLAALLDASKSSARTLRMTRLGSVPADFKIDPGVIGFVGKNLPADPGMVLLATAKTQCPTALHDIAVVMYAPDDSLATANAMSRLSGTVPAAIEHFLIAWIAMAAGDDGLAATHLDHPLLLADTSLIEVRTDTVAALRGRTGRLLWAWPHLATNPTETNMLRHLIATIPPAERFVLFTTGLPLDAWRSNGRETLHALSAETKNALQSGTMTIYSDHSPRPHGLEITDFPAHGEFRATLAIHNLHTEPSSADSLHRDHSVNFGFHRCSKSMVSPRGCGRVQVTAESTMQIAVPNLDVEEFPKPLTIPNSAPFTTTTTNHQFRIIRWDHQQRFEIDGHCILQGFLPLPSSPTNPETFTLYVQTNGVEAELTQMQMLVPNDVATPTNF